MDNFRALPKLNEKLEDLLRGTQARIAKVVGVYGSEVEVEMTGGARARYATTQTSVPIGQPGIIVSGFGSTGIFIPLHMSNPLGKHWYDRGSGVQIGSIAEANIGVDATGFVAIGTGAKANGPNNVAVGRLTETHGGHSIAIGYSSVAQHSSVVVGIRATSGSVATAVGYWSHADGANATAVGRDTNASSTSTVAVGYSASASANWAVAIGASASANTNSEYGIAIGSSAATTGAVAVAIGRTATAVARSVSVGWNTTTSAEYSVAVGYGANAGYSGSQYGEVAIGKNAAAKTARAIAIGFGATTSYHYEAKIMARGLIIESSQDGLNTTKLGLYSSNGTRYFLTVSNTGVLSTTTSW